jgi:ribonuclease HII
MKIVQSKLKSFMLPCLEAGVDEVGRGCFSGSVFAAAVILPSDFDNPLIKDSKKLSEKQRLQASEIIKSQALSYSIAYSTSSEIDSMNILQATFQAMWRAIDALNIKPEHILIDGDKFKKYPGIPHTCVVKGDATYYSIAAASILAKVERDFYMNQIAKEYPLYGWDSNKGYGTLEHRQALLEYGPTPYHRKTFISNYVAQKTGSLF